VRRDSTRTSSATSKAAPLLPGPGRLDGGVQGQQVGLLGDAADGGQNAADLLGVAIQLVDGLAGVGDLRQPRDAALALADLGLAGHREAHRIAGGVGGKLGVAGDLLGGGGHLGHRGRHHDDRPAAGAPLAAGLGPRRLGAGLGRQLDGDVPQPADDAVQSRHELVEVLGQLPHLILAAGGDLHREIPLPVGDVGERPGDPSQIREQVVEHGDEQGTEHQQQYQGQPHQLPQQGGERRLQHLLVHHHGEQPVGAGHALHRKQHLAPVQVGAVQLAVAAPRIQRRPGEAGIQLRHLLERQLLVRVADDEAGAVEQHGVALSLHLHGQHLVDEGVEEGSAPATPITRPWWLTGSARVTTICCMVTLT
jgi:hypothetical protein